MQHQPIVKKVHGANEWAQALSAPISSLSLMFVQTQAWGERQPPQSNWPMPICSWVRLPLSWLFWWYEVVWWEKCFKYVYINWNIAISGCRRCVFQAFLHSWYFLYTLMYWYLSHWGRVAHICVRKLTTIRSDYGLSPGRPQVIIRNYAGVLLIGPFNTNIS